MQDLSPKLGLAAFFDINRMMKIEEKFESEEAVEILRKVISELICVQKEHKYQSFRAHLWELRALLIKYSSKEEEFENFKMTAQ